MVQKRSLFLHIISLGILNIIMDVLTVYTINHLDTVKPVWNMLAHIGYFTTLEAVVYSIFEYTIYITGFYPKEKKRRFIFWSPLIAYVLIVVFTAPYLTYVESDSVHYCVGFAAYTAYAVVFICIISCLIIFSKGWKFIDRRKCVYIRMFLWVLLAMSVIQIVWPRTQLSSLAITIILLGLYLNEDNPAMKELADFHKEMTSAFANMVENRDENTGGHINRVTAYVSLLARGLQERKMYTRFLTLDYIEDLERAAPLHDVGKISIPDAILQKPGKLNDEEYEIMKTHTTIGAEIVRRSFSRLDDEEYNMLVYEVARYHHEKWNGTGYPEGLKGEDIPLSARIMAVADVFDAISQRRCYREAMSLDTCFEIIQKGSGTDFDPQVVEVFMELRSEVEKIYQEFA